MSITLTAALAALLAANTPDPSTDAAARAAQLHRDAIVIDGHVDTPSAILDLKLDPANALDAANCQPAMPTYDGALEPRADLRSHTLSVLQPMHAHPGCPLTRQAHELLARRVEFMGAHGVHPDRPVGAVMHRDGAVRKQARERQ